MAGVAFVDFGATYNEVNYKYLFNKIHKMTDDLQFVQIIRFMMRVRPFCGLRVDGWPSARKYFRGTSLKTLYCNQQPINKGKQHFLYADDLFVTAQGQTHRST